MSLLTICQNVANEAGYPSPASIVGNNDISAIHLLASAKRAVKELARKDWAVLLKEHTFTTQANIDNYALPSDFAAFVPDTQWDRSDADPMQRLSPQRWQANKSWLVSTIFSNYRIKVRRGTKRFYIDPTPSGVNTIAFDYRSNAPVIDVNLAVTDDDRYLTTFDADDNQVLIDEDMVELGTLWRFLKRKGEAYFEEKEDYDRALSQVFADDSGLDTVNMTKRRRRLIGFNTGQTRFGL